MRPDDSAETLPALAVGSQVAVLFVHPRSYYKLMPNCRTYGLPIADVRLYAGGMPIVAHPPCRAWSCLKAFAKPPPGERRLAIWSILQARRNGGVVEHPKGSGLWKVMKLPKPGEFPDQWGGWTIEVDQFHWGHKARKTTWLYIVGTKILPPIPRRTGEPTHVVDRPGRHRKLERPNSAAKKPWLTHDERQLTPPEFAKWLVAVALLCSGNTR